MIGTKLAHYTITAHLGSGGFGDVYQATDSKLDRSVAIKLLPEAFARDSERVARFEREARLLASLNHPNIAAIYGIDQSGERKFLVMELVPGETLAKRIKRGPIPVNEALGIAIEIAKALEAAHDSEKGIIHRDLKSANVMITPDGKVKVLDFGLAKAYSGATTEASDAPTMMSIAATNAGVILGTAAYMSPEQAKGRRVDRRTDIFAFGCVLYEMLTGRAAFEGEDLQDILSRVLQREPDWTLLPADVPPRIRELLKLCLQKDSRKRRADAADVRIDIEQAVAEPPAPAAIAKPGKGRERLAWAAALVGVAVAAAAIAVVYFRPTPVSPPLEVRLQINTPPGNPVMLAVSPDGRRLVFQATVDGETQLWLRPLESESALPLAGTENGTYPCWSPDSSSIGFLADQKLKRIDVAGGAAQTLADAPGTGGCSWGPEGVILFSRPAGLYRIGADGGQAMETTRLASSQGVHRFPGFLPDGRHFLFYATGTSDVRGVYVGSLDSSETQRLFEAGPAGVFAPPDYVLFVRQETLVAQRIDVEKLATVGEPFPVSERLARDPALQASVGLSASASGPIAYRTAPTASRQLLWFDRSGRQTGAIGQPDTTAAATEILRLSPNGDTAAFPRIVNGNEDIWLMDLGRGVLRRLTFDPAAEEMPVWSPDGKSIAFTSYRKGIYNLHQRLVNSTGPDEVLLESSENKNAWDWSSDGRFFLYTALSSKTARDIWALPMEGDRKPFVVVQTGFEESGAHFSPDGHWIAYASNETGRTEIYVQPFPGPGTKSVVSTNGGGQPRWRRDRREIFYVEPGNRLMAVAVTLHANPASIDVGTPAPLFTTARSTTFAPSPDGQRFLINTPIGDVSTPPITVILNWRPPVK